MSLKAKKNDWVRLFSVVSSYTKDAKVTVNEGRATILAIDAAKVAIVKGSIDCEGECDDFTLNVEQVLKALNAAGGDDVTFSFDENMSDLTIIGNARVKMPLEADMGDIRDINRSMFDEINAQGKFNPADVEQCVSYGLWNKEGAVTITIKDGTTNVRVGQERHTAEVDCEGAEGEAFATYPLDYFDTMLKQSKGSEVTVKIPNNDYPALIEWQSGTGDFSLVIAPRVEQE